MNEMILTLDVRAYETWLQQQPGCQNAPEIDPRDSQCRAVILLSDSTVCQALSERWYRCVPNTFLRGGR